MCIDSWFTATLTVTSKSERLIELFLISGDFGGNLGLCLGGSILTFYELFEICYLNIQKRKSLKHYCIVIVMSSDIFISSYFIEISVLFI